MAGAVAASLKAGASSLLTDVSGILDKDKKLISSMNRSQAVKSIEDGTVTGGMIPKVTCCLEAVEAGVEKAHVIDGRIENSIILELFTGRGIGTEITCNPSKNCCGRKVLR